MSETDKTPIGDLVESFLQEEFEKKETGLELLAILQNEYNICLDDLGSFKLFSRPDQLNLVYLSGTTLEAYQYVPSRRSLIHLTSLPYADVCDFIIETTVSSKPELIRAKEMRYFDRLGTALSKLLEISADEATLMMIQLPTGKQKPIKQIVLGNFQRKN